MEMKMSNKQGIKNMIGNSWKEVSRANEYTVIIFPQHANRIQRMQNFFFCMH